MPFQSKQAFFVKLKLFLERHVFYFLDLFFFEENSHKQQDASHFCYNNPPTYSASPVNTSLVSCILYNIM